MPIQSSKTGNSWCEIFYWADTWNFVLWIVLYMKRSDNTIFLENSYILILFEYQNILTTSYWSLKKYQNIYFILLYFKWPNFKETLHIFGTLWPNFKETVHIFGIFLSPFDIPLMREKYKCGPVWKFRRLTLFLYFF